MKQVLGIKDEAARMKVTPPLAVAPLAHGDDMRWNPNDDGINFNPQFDIGLLRGVAWTRLQ